MPRSLSFVKPVSAAELFCYVLESPSKAKYANPALTRYDGYEVTSGITTLRPRFHLNISILVIAANEIGALPGR